MPGCSRHLFLESLGCLKIRGDPIVSLILIVKQVIIIIIEKNVKFP